MSKCFELSEKVPLLKTLPFAIMIRLLCALELLIVHGMPASVITLQPMHFHMLITGVPIPSYWVHNCPRAHINAHSTKSVETHVNQ